MKEPIALSVGLILGVFLGVLITISYYSFSNAEIVTHCMSLLEAVGYELTLKEVGICRE